MLSKEMKIKISIEEAIEQINPSSIVSTYKYFCKNRNMPSKSISALVKKGNAIFQNIKKHPGKITLLMGQVQSGKTAAYSSVIANAFDNECNFVVITPSVNNVLLLQNIERMKETFVSSRIHIKSIKNGLDVQKIYDNLKNKDKIILISLKNNLRLKQTISLINKIKDKIKFPIFIDDEGDQASFDDVTKEESRKIFTHINNIKNICENMNMLTVTATPMAHILVDKNYKIKPDYCFYIEPGPKYIGAEKFADPDNNYIEIMDNIIDKEFFKTNALPPLEFSKALLSFFTSSALLHLREGKLSPTSMFIHVDRAIINLKEMIQIIETRIHNIKNKNNQSWINKFIEDFVLKHPEINNLSKFKSLVLEHIKFYSSILVIGDNKIKDNAEKALYSPSHKNCIFIGSTMLQRGITIPNLIHTYFTYRSKGILNADTILQRARWFGYIKYPDLIKVFMSASAKSDFDSLAIMVPDMVEKIKILEKKLIPFPTGMARSIYLPNAELRGTRKSVVHNSRINLGQFIFDNSLNSSKIAEEMYNDLNENKNKIRFFDTRYYEGITFSTYDEFVDDYCGHKEIKQLYKSANMSKEDIKTLENIVRKEKMNVVLVNMYKKNKQALLRSNKTKTIFVSTGRTDDTYVGDRYWQNDESNRFINSLVIHLYKIQIIENQHIIYKAAISTPSNIQSYWVHAQDKTKIY